MRVIARCVAEVIDNYRDASVLEKVKLEIKELVSDFPLYPNFSILE
jgi:glycine/serine hydroxymethyltransferase